MLDPPAATRASSSSSPSPQPPPRRRPAASSVDEPMSSLLVHDGERLMPTTTGSKKQQAEMWERVSMKAQAGAWVLGAVALAHYTDLVHVLLNDDRIHRGYFHVALVCLGINLCIGVYLTVYLPYVKGVDLDWAIYCPRMIPAATLAGVVCAFTLINSLWPIYGFLAPLILLVLLVGSIFALHFVPWPF